MNIKSAKKLLSNDYDTMSLDDLQNYKVKLLDALRESNGEFGMEQAVCNGFYKFIDGGYIPTDLWLSYNLKFLFEKVTALEEKRFSNIA